MGVGTSTMPTGILMLGCGEENCIQWKQLNCDRYSKAVEQHSYGAAQ